MTNITTHGNVLGIKRSDSDTGIDGLFGYSASDVENESRIEVVKNDFNYVLEEYKRILELSEGEVQLHNTNFVLSSLELQTFFTLTQKNQSCQTFNPNTGYYISKLIQNSYDNGYNGFKFINRGKTACDHFFDSVKGTKNNPINIYFGGVVGFCFGQDSENVNAIVKGEALFSPFGSSKNVNLWMKGYAGSSFGYESINLTATIVGFVSQFFGEHSTNLTAAIDGNSREALGSNSTSIKIYLSGQCSMEPCNYGGEIFFGDDATNHNEYKRMMGKFDEKMKEFEEVFR